MRLFIEQICVKNEFSIYNNVTKMITNIQLSRNILRNWIIIKTSKYYIISKAIAVITIISLALGKQQRID